jgi:hypothetical protein
MKGLIINIVTFGNMFLTLKGKKFYSIAKFMLQIIYSVQFSLQLQFNFELLKLQDTLFQMTTSCGIISC